MVPHSVLRPVGLDDLDAVRAVERAAGEPFRALGMDAVADDRPPSMRVLRGVVERGRAWLVEDLESGRIVGYLLGDVVDGCGHVEQVSVDPADRGHRVGRRLVEHFATWSSRRGLPALTLITYAAVPWNAPYYARLGFRTLGDAELGPGLRALRRAETARGLDRWPRVAMRRDLDRRRPARDPTGDRDSVG